MTTTPFIKKLTALGALAGIFLLSGVIIFQLQTAFGWTNPSQSPPNGAGAVMVDPVSGNVGVKWTGQGSAPPDVLSVNGVINAMTHLIHGVVTPVVSTDAANKQYVDDAVAAAGGNNGTFIVYGVSGTINPNPKTRAAGNQSGCFLGASGSSCGTLPSGVGLPPAGSGVTCPAGSTSLMAGYGPHGNLFVWFAGGSDTDNVPPVAPAAATYSECSQSSYQYIQFRYSNTNANQVSFQPAILDACVTSVDPNTGQTTTACNTCRVCKIP